MRFSKVKLQLWIARRYLMGSGLFVNTTSALSILGMTIGVSCLIVAMAVVSGFETTLKSSVVESVGDLAVMGSGGGIKDAVAVENKIKESDSRIKAITPFVHLEGLAAAKGNFHGVVLQGLDPESVHSVLKLKSHIREGEFRLEGGNNPTLLVGKVFAEKLGVKVGDLVQIVIPRLGTQEDQPFRPLTKKFQIVGILDFGKHDYDLRFGIMNIKTAQEFRLDPETVSGFRLKLDDSNHARSVAFRVNEKMGTSYWTRDWKEVNENLFSAIELEKIVIFIIPLFMVIAAGFNIASALYITVLRRYQDISVLKTLGATKNFIVTLFCCQGLLVGALGAALGVVLGLILCQTLVHSALHWIPSEIYKLDRLNVEIRWTDMLAILGSSMLICFLSSLKPALQAANLRPVEGLRYE